MSIEDDVALLERVPTLRLLGTRRCACWRSAPSSAITRPGDQLFNAGDEADAGYIVQRGAFRVEDGGAEVIAGPGALIGELALIVAMRRPSSAVAIEHSTVIRVARSLFQRVLESDPAAARRLRDELATRTSQLASDILMAGAKLSISDSQHHTSSVTVTGTWSDGRSQPEFAGDPEIADAVLQRARNPDVVEPSAAVTTVQSAAR